MRKILDEHALPTSDFDSDAIAWLLAIDGGTFQGTVGLEAYGQTGLLRSLVSVAPGRGVGTALVGAAERLARGQGIESLYLLTETAEQFFLRMGYQQVERSSAPTALLSTTEFQSLCPSSATCMMRALP